MLSTGLHLTSESTAPLLQPSKEDGDALLWGGLPVLVKQSPEVEGKGVPLGEGEVVHGEYRALPLIDALQEELDNHILEVVAVKIARN